MKISAIEKVWAKFDPKKKLAPEMTPDSDQEIEQPEQPEQPAENKPPEQLIVTTQGFNFFDLSIDEQERVLRYYAQWIQPVIKEYQVLELFLDKSLRWYCLATISDKLKYFCVFTFTYPCSYFLTFGGDYQTCKQYLDEKMSSNFVIPVKGGNK